MRGENINSSSCSFGLIELKKQEKLYTLDLPFEKLIIKLVFLLRLSRENKKMEGDFKLLKNFFGKNFACNHF